MSEGQLSIAPSVQILSVLKHLNYQPWYALAEYVDNAVASAEKDHDALFRVDPAYQLGVAIEFDDIDGGTIMISDNAGGIHRHEFERAFRAAEIPPDRTGLNEFGMGMKSASIWFADRWEVRTTSIGDEHEYRVEFNMDDIYEHQASVVDVHESPIDINAHYTVITLRQVRGLPKGRTLGKIRDHLRDIYREYLRTQRMRLHVGGEELQYQPVEVMRAPDYRESQKNAAAPVLEWRKPIQFTFGDGIQVRGFAGLRETMDYTSNGFALFRRGRVILGSADKPYRPAAIFGIGQSYRTGRLFGEFHIDGLDVSHTKDGFQWGELEEEFVSLLRKQLDDDHLPLLRQADQFRKRAAGPQQNRVIEQAYDSTARSIREQLPSYVAQVSLEPTKEAGIGDLALPPVPSVREAKFEFFYRHERWQFEVAVADRPEVKRLALVERDQVANPPGTRVRLTLNASHDFIKEFALDESGAFEAVLRMVVALTMSEQLLLADDHTFAPKFVRRLDEILSGPLAKRVIE